jgi:hypothetical protein
MESQKSARPENSLESGERKPHDLNYCRLVVIAFLWALIGLGIGVFWYASPMLALLVIFGTCKLAGYCRKKIQVNMVPPTLIVRVRGNELYQMYVVRAVRRQGSHLLLWIAAISFVFTVGNWVDSLNPVLDLEEMDVKTGVVEKVYMRQRVGTRKGCGDIIYLRVEDGTLIRYNGLLNDDALRILYGRTTKEVTLWSQKEIQLPPCAKKNWINQIEVGNQIVDRYNKHWHERTKKWLLRLNVIYPVIGFLALFGIWRADRRSKYKNSTIR